MQEFTNKNQNTSQDNEIDLLFIIKLLFQEKKTIIKVSIFITIIGVIYSLFLPNIYESKALIAPTVPSSKIQGALQNYSSIASLGGITLPGNNENDNSKQAIAKITSLSFYEKDILPNIFLPNLMAIKSFNHEENTIVYDNSIYIEDSKKWVRKYSYPQKQIPSAQESFEVFINNHFNLNEDKLTGFYTISIKHQSPYIAQKWTKLIVDRINFFYRQKDKIESEKAISYLNKIQTTTNLSELKQSISLLLQEEIKKLTLIEATEFYVFDYIDSPAAAEKKSEPRRIIILLLSIIIGGMLGIGFVLVRHYAYNEKKVFE